MDSYGFCLHRRKALHPINPDLPTLAICLNRCSAHRVILGLT